MKKILLFLIFLNIFSILYSQNLVPNSSFEDTLWCPFNTMQINAANHWFAPGGGGGSSELFHECNNYPHPPWSTGIVGIPKNAFGFQYANSGNSYAGITFYTEGEGTRENIEVQLINVLNPVRTYYAEFYISLANVSAYGIENIGAYFSNNMLTYAGHHPAMLSLTPHIEHSGSPIIDTLNWIKVSGYFKPNDEGTKYMTIGNFADSGQTVYQKINNGVFTWAYYYIDDVFVADSVSYVNSIKELEIQKGKIKIYPNPANESLTIEIDNLSSTYNFKVEIYNCFGAVVKTVFIKQYEKSIDVRDLPQGFYIVAVQSKGKILARQKVIISR